MELCFGRGFGELVFVAGSALTSGEQSPLQHVLLGVQIGVDHFRTTLHLFVGALDYAFHQNFRLRIKLVELLLQF